VSMVRCAVLAIVIGVFAPAAMAQAASAQRRLSHADISALSSTGAGVGTSGVAGIRTTVLSGNPTVTGPYTIMLRVPANTKIAAHRHRDDRSAVVVSGTWWFGYGSRSQEAQFKAMGPGSFYTEPAGEAHFARTGDQAVVVYISGFGPTDTKYLAAGEH
jgi:quercetin dioxygenase-like cupin family protein